MRILILGGTADAAALAERLANDGGTDVMLSLAGRTQHPKAAPVPMRVGGFGGVAGLTTWLSENRTDCVFDATHPFAAVISRNAAQACGALGIPLLALRRPPWRRQAGDAWIEAATMADVVAALGDAPRRVFLTIGRLELAAFASAPQHHYLVRTIEPIDDALPVPHVTTLQARGPFDEDAEAALMREHGIEILVSKNSGGAATYGKIIAARRLAIPVVLVSRPAAPEVPSTDSIEAALSWIGAHRQAP
ncbi:cobalt-precorrin-6A reductase [Microvirga brassicacearum]|uniref:Cobalt-precorrin-6A reductase n=1 Tax=Microvirga brassicacearum TaxID=2580413 RepID=A0A5N3P6K4_9HYPH|nr:cobalt-precorrin-6A reductase [Microvirga brassicacearum]KAB0265364.1 cobalt-precorrin-6A reductase [Microvirga brassicacearum]